MRGLSESKIKLDGTRPSPITPQPNIKPRPRPSNKTVYIIIKEAD